MFDDMKRLRIETAARVAAGIVPQFQGVPMTQERANAAASYSLAVADRIIELVTKEKVK